MAVSKYFEYINNNGAKTAVELGAKAQNVDVDGTPLTAVLDGKLEKVVLDEGAFDKHEYQFSENANPQSGIDYDGGAKFTRAVHCTIHQADGFATVTSDELAVVGIFGRAIFCFPDTMRTDAAKHATITISCDIRIPVNSRWIVGLVDLDRRGFDAGGSTRNTYSLDGVAAWCGVDNETGLIKLNKYRLDQLNTGIAEDKKNWSDKWIRFEAEVFNGSKWATCYLKDPDTDEQLCRTNIAFLDPDAADNDVSVTGIEFYTWTENHIDIDNISVEITGGWDENTLYLLPNGNGYRYFVFQNGTRYEIGAVPADATATASGLMSASDKKKLDGIDSGANKTTVDVSLSPTSQNPVQNKAINTALSNKAPLTHVSESVASQNGAHSLRYFEGKLQYKDGSTWKTLSIAELLI